MAALLEQERVEPVPDARKPITSSAFAVGDPEDSRSAPTAHRAARSMSPNAGSCSHQVGDPLLAGVAAWPSRCQNPLPCIVSPRRSRRSVAARLLVQAYVGNGAGGSRDPFHQPDIVERVLGSAAWPATSRTTSRPEELERQRALYGAVHRRRTRPGRRHHPHAGRRGRDPRRPRPRSRRSPPAAPQGAARRSVRRALRCHRTRPPLGQHRGRAAQPRGAAAGHRARPVGRRPGLERLPPRRPLRGPAGPGPRRRHGDDPRPDARRGRRCERQARA